MVRPSLQASTGIASPETWDCRIAEASRTSDPLAAIEANATSARSPRPVRLDTQFGRLDSPRRTSIHFLHICQRLADPAVSDSIIAHFRRSPPTGRLLQHNRG